MESAVASYTPNYQQTAQLRELTVSLLRRSIKLAAARTATRTMHLFLYCSVFLPSATRKLPRPMRKLPTKPRRVHEPVLSELIRRRWISPPSSSNRISRRIHRSPLKALCSLKPVNPLVDCLPVPLLLAQTLAVDSLFSARSVGINPSRFRILTFPFEGFKAEHCANLWVKRSPLF